MIKGYLKKYLKINEIFLVRKKGRCFKKMVMVESLLFYRSWTLEAELEPVKKLPGAGKK